MQNDERTTRLEENYESIIGAIHSLDKKLFGNGQPGLVALLSSRITRLETSLALAIGGGVVIVFAIKYL
jgi:hypothetical protein